VQIAKVEMKIILQLMKTNKPQHVIATSASTFSLMRKIKGERRRKENG
jgi:hypothetical protein